MAPKSPGSWSEISCIVSQIQPIQSNLSRFKVIHNLLVCYHIELTYSRCCTQVCNSRTHPMRVKKFLNPKKRPGANVIKLFCPRFTNFHVKLEQGILRGKYHCTIDLLFDWFGIGCTTTDNFGFYLQNRLIQTSQTGGQTYSDTYPFSIPWLECLSPVSF